MRGNTVTRDNSEKTACKHGHPFTDDNTRYRIHKKYGSTIRQCITC